MSAIVPIILSGGSGTRMWPLSREHHPKQLLALLDNHTLLQRTALRLANYEGIESTIVVCGEMYRFLVAQQLHEVSFNGAKLMLEPEGRNTAPAVALAAFYLNEKDPNATMVVMPADHLIQDLAAFQSILASAIIESEKGFIVTFGVVPTEANTEYGYIVADFQHNEAIGKIESFLEKPSKKVAARMLLTPNVFWNRGIFVFKVGTLLEELKNLAPDTYLSCQRAVLNATDDLDFIRPDEAAFLSSPSISLDHAVMEKTDKAVMMPFDGGWSDIGSWERLWELCLKDANRNFVLGDVLTEDTYDSYLHATSRCLATVGIKNLTVIETPDAVLIAEQGQSQNIQKIVNKLNQSGRKESLLHRKVHRPWGSYECIETGNNFKVKRLVVMPGARLSLQKHEHRAEHWVVVNGTASVIRAEQEFDLEANESIFIPVGVKHRIANATQTELVIIEVQTGTYLEEDDIIRFEDIYGRIID